jgi:glucokinase
MASRSKLRGGIDLGGTKIQAVVVDADSKVLGSARCPTPTAGGPPAVASAMAGALGGAVEDAGVEASKLRGVGVGSPGDIDAKAGTVARAGNLPDWDKPFELGKALTDALGMRVALGNDVGVATEAEFRLGAGKPYDSLIGVFWGTGVGGGLILDGKQWLGRGGAGEIGHVVVKEDGARCPCGRQGCMEAYAGRGAMEAKARSEHDDGRKTDLFKLMKKHGRERLTSGIWQRALDADDKLAHELIDRAVEAIGTAVASVINVLDVEAVIIGGGLGVRFGEPYAKKIEKRARKNLFNDSRPPDFRVASLGDFGGAIGAALLVDAA